jgi:two-component system sensor histidine kinase SenX3
VNSVLTALVVVLALVAGLVLGLVLATRRRRGSALATAALQVLHVAALVVDDHGRVAIGNPAAQAMGLVRGDQLAVPELRTLTEQARRAGRPREAQVRLLHGWLEREPQAVLGRAAPIGMGGHVALLVEDVTEARRIADVRRDFVANVSHELKTPVGAIALLAEALGEAEDDPEAVRHFGDRLRHESVRLSRLAQGLIDLSRLEAADAPEPVPVPVSGVVAEALDRVATAARARGAEVVVEGDEGCVVAGVHDQLVTALVNLLDNAIRYGPPGGRVTVTVRGPAAASKTGGGPLVEIVVSDQGPGIAEPDLERVFERFYRADPARASKTGGTGLGLAIVKHAAANHGGRVEVSSTPGRGSRFTLTLPAHTASPVVTTPPVMAPRVTAAPPTPGPPQ